MIVVGIASFTLMAPAAVVAIPGLAGVAAASTINSSLCNGAKAATGGSAANTCAGGDTTITNSINKIAGQVVNIISIIVGVIAVIFIIYGGFKYITSGGDSGKVSEAKNALIYAIIGLLVVAIAQAIVRFVLTAGNNINGAA